MATANWKPHVFRVGPSEGAFDDPPAASDASQLRRDIEPWLAALFQSEHLSVLLGSGFTLAIASLAGTEATRMEIVDMSAFDLASHVNTEAERVAKASGRGVPNVEDQIRVLSELANGLRILQDRRLNKCEKVLNAV